MIQNGLKEFEEVLDLRKENSKLPKSNLEYVLRKTIETRAGGRLDPKQSGMEQTKSLGMRSVQNCRKVFQALLGMYPVGSDVNSWLSVEIPKWERLGDAIFDVGCFLKSQKKRSPILCDKLLVRLWRCWEDAFPGKAFNKYHGLFCQVRCFVHSFERASRVSEESNEAYNATLRILKEVLMRMPSSVQRVQKITERAQVNLKEDVMESTMVVVKRSKGKKRGPYEPAARYSDDRELMGGDEVVLEVK